jgi:hypothetical protein
MGLKGSLSYAQPYEVVLQGSSPDCPLDFRDMICLNTASPLTGALRISTSNNPESLLLLVCLTKYVFCPSRANRNLALFYDS